MTEQELIERLERSTGPSLELDADIHAFAFGGIPAKRALESWMRSYSANFVFANNDGRPSKKDGHAAPYTAAIDAALTLLPEGYAVQSLSIWVGEPATVTILGAARRPFGKDRRISWCHTAKDGKWSASAATAPLAISAAALKARVHLCADPQSAKTAT